MRAASAVGSESATAARVIREHGEALRRDFREAAEDHDALRFACDHDGQDTGTQEHNHRRVVGQDAEIAFDPRKVDLVDITGKQQLIRRNQVEVEGSHP